MSLTRKNGCSFSVNFSHCVSFSLTQWSSDLEYQSERRQYGRQYHLGGKQLFHLQMKEFSRCDTKWDFLESKISQHLKDL